MSDSTAQSLLALHTSFWNRELKEPVININCSLMRRTKFVPALPPQWENQDSLTLQPEMLSPERFQPAPLAFNREDPTYDEIAFNT